MESESKLPPELERQIFELAAYSHSKSIPSFLLVVRRVKIWVEPILYSVVVFSNPRYGHVCFDPVRLSSAIQSPAISQHIKNLCVSYPADVSQQYFDTILANCSVVQNLAVLGGHPNLLQFLSAMPLLRLAAALAFFFPRRVDFSHPLFSNITHLYLWDDIIDAMSNGKIQNGVGSQPFPISHIWPSAQPDLEPFRFFKTR
ncbi:hypothetical protein C8R45DRAFT_1151122 [Mycena sanguinolenta]|nr:hypothetical protein C8R45DRAFT_1151122 [Mycena sanguinolenta]